MCVPFLGHPPRRSLRAMARTKERIHPDQLTAQQAAAAARVARKRTCILKAARILSSQDVAMLHMKEPCTCAQSDGVGDGA